MKRLRAEELGPEGVGASMIRTRSTKDGEIRTRSTKEGGRNKRKKKREISVGALRFMRLVL